MKKLLVILLCLPMFLPAQNSTNYKEFNSGIFLGEDITFFPGASFLWGKTIYFNNNTFLDYQGGFAFPTVFTGKIGIGIGNEKSASSIGLRPFPSSLYFQYNWDEKRLFSIEFMPPIIDGSPGAKWPVIINYGFRW